MDSIRKEFEIWAESRGLDLYCSRKDLYEDTETLWAWSAWRASRESVVVELPLITASMYATKHSYLCASEATDWTGKAIRMKGIRTK